MADECCALSEQNGVESGWAGNYIATTTPLLRVARLSQGGLLGVWECASVACMQHTGMATQARVPRGSYSPGVAAIPQCGSAAVAQEAAGVAACPASAPHAAAPSNRTTHPPCMTVCSSARCCAWCCRMHVCIEDLLADNELISLLQDLLLLSDRAKLADLPALAASS